MLGDVKPQYYCSQCDAPLKGKRYIMRKDQPACLDCYNCMFTDKCEKCMKMITTDEKDLSYNNRHWHEACFKCDTCAKSLAASQFITSPGSAIHCMDCYDEKFSRKCDLCGLSMKHGGKQFEYGGKYYHESCFKCSECDQPIGNNPFVPRDDKLMCMDCFKAKIAQKCACCGEVLMQGGVTFRDAAFHRECFVCTCCNKQLADVKFATQQHEPFCTDCYVKLYSQICDKCCKPITGLGSATRFVSFDSKQWHAECFTCSTCDKNLSAMGFLIHEGDVICTECGKNL